MIRALIFIFWCLLLCSFQGDRAYIDKGEAKAAFTYLNQIRVNPDSYAKELGLPAGLKVTRTQLRWNDTLAKVAERKALDMANRNYYSHIDPEGYGINHYISLSGYKLTSDWLVNKNANYFESVLAGVDNGTDAINKFIKDEGVKSLQHRNHLLGLDQWNSSLTDIGIGFARRQSGSTYKTYVSLVIAKHGW